MTPADTDDEWEEPVRRPGGADDQGVFVLDLDGYEGPIDVLLALARQQKVDLTRLSILRLAEQYLAFILAAHRVNLELAAGYLVMAAWLVYLKSRLLLPAEAAKDDEPSGPELAEALTFQLRRLEGMQEAGNRLMARPRLGRDVFRTRRPGRIRSGPTTGLRGLVVRLAVGLWTEPPPQRLGAESRAEHGSFDRRCAGAAEGDVRRHDGVAQLVELSSPPDDGRADLPLGGGVHLRCEPGACPRGAAGAAPVAPSRSAVRAQPHTPARPGSGDRTWTMTFA